MSSLLEGFSRQDADVFDNEFSAFLPSEIHDSHVHLWQKGFLEKTIEEDRRKIQPFYDGSIDGFTIEDCEYVTKKLFPNKNYSSMFMGLPFKEVNLDESNDYVSYVCTKKNSYGLFIPTPDQEGIPEDFFKKRFIGFKPYPDLAFESKNPGITQQNMNIGIFDFISKKVLEFSNEYGLLLLIHLPREERLRSKKNIEEIKSISKRYPNIKIILAHAGRSYCYWDIKDAIGYLKNIKNLYVDTAMINSLSVNKLLMRELGPDRILYGSDLAVAALKGKNVDINNKHYFVTKEPKLWSISSKDVNLENFTYFIYEIIRSIKLASEEIGLIQDDIRNIFYRNIKNLISDVIKNIK
jgi:uncharacterized protein